MTKASTETALQSAMTALLRTRPLQKLTVGEIARAAGVSRVTFYHYYRDLYDLAGAVLAGEMERAMGADQTPENWEEGLLRLMTLQSAVLCLCLGCNHLLALVQDFSWEHGIHLLGVLEVLLLGGVWGAVLLIRGRDKR